MVVKADQYEMQELIKINLQLYSYMNIDYIWYSGFIILLADKSARKIISCAIVFKVKTGAVPDS